MRAEASIQPPFAPVCGVVHVIFALFSSRAINDSWEGAAGTSRPMNIACAVVLLVPSLLIAVIRYTTDPFCCIPVSCQLLFSPIVGFVIS